MNRILLDKGPLSIVDLSSNEIEFIQGSIKQALPHTTHLYLHRNRLQVLPSGLHQLSLLARVTVYDNPLNNVRINGCNQKRLRRALTMPIYDCIAAKDAIRILSLAGDPLWEIDSDLPTPLEEAIFAKNIGAVNFIIYTGLETRVSVGDMVCSCVCTEM